MHSNDGHGIQPHITFHFQLFALFLRISSVCGRVFVYLFTQVFDIIEIKHSFYFITYVDNHYYSRSFGYLFCKW